MIGQRLGSFTIQSLLGEGGMGQVYRARDSRLDRDVAIKILPNVWLADPERRARFDREARMLAALNHPHVGAIYGVEDVDGVPALVLELVEGPTLAERLERGPLALTDALTISPQISPDGTWLAHNSDESGRLEIYVSPFPGPGGKIAISTDGGTEPRWSRDGRELFYRQADRMMVVTITPGSSLTASSPRVLFEGRYQVSDTNSGGYDVAPDGRFLMIQHTVAEQPATEFNIVLGWFNDVRARSRTAAP